MSSGNLFSRSSELLAITRAHVQPVRLHGFETGWPIGDSAFRQPTLPLPQQIEGVAERTVSKRGESFDANRNGNS